MIAVRIHFSIFLSEVKSLLFHKFTAFGKIMVATGANKNVVLIDPETGSKCDSNLAPFFTGLYGGAGGLITVDGEPTPLICGGNGPYTKKCYIGKESGGVWEDIGISLDGKELGWSDMGSATIGDWAFITGGWNQAKNDKVKSTFLVNGKGNSCILHAFLVVLNDDQVLSMWVHLKEALQDVVR